MNKYQEIVMSNKALKLIIEERIRQTLVEGYTLAHDDEHTDGQLAMLAAAYALSSRGVKHYDEALQEVASVLNFSDWFDKFKSQDPIHDLVRAGALILAELERRLRAER
jgi:hypothetical protein